MRLIDADKLQFTNEWLSDESGTTAQFMMVSKADVDAAPTVDVESVKHGHWVKGIQTARCSRCGHYALEPASYCCCCGARMDEEVPHVDS